MAPKHSVQHNKGGRGKTETQDMVDDLPKRGFDEKQIRAHLKQLKYSPGWITQLLKPRFGPASRSRQQAVLQRSKAAMQKDDGRRSEVESANLVQDCGASLMNKCLIQGGCSSLRDWWGCHVEVRASLGKLPCKPVPWDDNLGDDGGDSAAGGAGELALDELPQFATCVSDFSLDPEGESDSDASSGSSVHIVAAKEIPREISKAEFNAMESIVAGKASSERDSLREKKIAGDGNCFFRSVAA